MSTSKPAVLLLLGGQYHDYEAADLHINAALAERFSVTTTYDPADLAGLENSSYAVVMIAAMYESLDEALAQSLVRFVENGGGLVGVHAAAAGFGNSETYLKLLGAQFIEHGPILEFEVKPTDAAHPVVTRTAPFRVTDELYILKPHADFHTFAVAHWQGQDQVMGYQRDVGAGRVLYLANGHDERTLGSAHFQRMLERATRVAAGATFNKTATAGILGYGGAFNMGKRHAELIRAQHNMDVVAVCDLDATRLEQARVELGENLVTYTDMNAFFNDGEFDVCVQILPHNLHADATIAAIKAGKHVISEKPFCLTLDEADAMIAAANEHDRMLSVYHNRRWDGDFHTIMQLVRSGVIGDVFRIDAALANYGEPGSWWRSHKPISGGAMYDWGAHYCDWTLNLMNKRIESVTGDYQKRKWFASTNEDYTYALIRFEDGTTATLEQGSLVALPRNGWRILGTEGAIGNNGPHQDISLVTFAHGKRVESGMTGQAVVENGFYHNIGNHLLMDERLVVTPEQARRAIGVIWLAEQSAMQGGVPLPLPGEETYEPDYMLPW